MALIADLLAAVRDAHTARALARALGSTLESYAPITRVDISTGDEPARPANAIELVPGLGVVVSRGKKLPDYFGEAAFRGALAQVVETARRHLAVVQRVADLSRRAHVESRELRADVERLTARPTLVARSAAMRAVLERAILVARHPTTVLLVGESGTGKEVVAREIHRLSPRAHRPMLHINCGAIPEALVESELFGHERGAFTGADRSYAGVFERGDRGTLLLDEVGDLPAAAQVKLLRVLQERKIRRVGGAEEIAIDVRLIAATNRPLVTLVRDGRFREDLYYRLDVFSISLPPLRERPDDLAPLVASLVADLATRLGVSTPSVSPTILNQLKTHHWPGNVRELANVLESAMILGAGRTIELPDTFASVPRSRLPAFDAAMRRVIESTLRATRGKIYGRDGAAALLDLKPGTLQSKMRKLGIERERFVVSR